MGQIVDATIGTLVPGVAKATARLRVLLLLLRCHPSLLSFYLKLIQNLLLSVLAHYCSHCNVRIGLGSLTVLLRLLVVLLLIMLG